MSRAEDLFNRAQIVKELTDDLAAEIAKLPTNYLNVALVGQRQYAGVMREMLDAQAKLASALQLLYAKVG